MQAAQSEVAVCYPALLSQLLVTVVDRRSGHYILSLAQLVRLYVFTHHVLPSLLPYLRSPSALAYCRQTMHPCKTRRQCQSACFDFPRMVYQALLGLFLNYYQISPNLFRGLFLCSPLPRYPVAVLRCGFAVITVRDPPALSHSLSTFLLSASFFFLFTFFLFCQGARECIAFLLA